MTKFRTLILPLFYFISLVALSCCFPFHPDKVSVHSASGRQKPLARQTTVTKIAQTAAFISVTAHPVDDRF